MDCKEVKTLLSYYFDDELSADKRAEFTEHFDACRDCRRELEAFRRLSARTKDLRQPEPAAHLWHKIEDRLVGKPLVKSKRRKFLEWVGYRRIPILRFGIAAFAILVAIGWFGYRAWFEHDNHGQLRAVFDRYIEEFSLNPQSAQHILLANYEGQVVDAAQAILAVGYRPAVADGVPDGYSIESTYVMKMPCCTCVQCLCNRSDGTSIAVFEHDQNEVEQWFHGRPEISAVCEGVNCRLVELNNRIAVSWQRGKRYITIVGIRDTYEINSLVAWFEHRRRVAQPSSNNFRGKFADFPIRL